MKKRLMFPLALSITGMMLAACGVDPGVGGTPTPTRGSTSTPTPTVEATATPTAVPTATPAGFDAQCVSTLALAAEPIRATIGGSKVPTAYDAINSGGCDFTKPITKITIVLEGPGGKQTVEIELDEPKSSIGFPLPEEMDIPVVDEDLEPGEYTRTVTVHTADGESQELEGFQAIELMEKDEAAQADLDAAMARWEQNGFSSYTYKAQWQCFCMDDYTAQVLVEVRGGEVVSVKYADERTADVPSPERFGTMDEMSDKVQQAIDEGAHRIQAEYDETLGYPANVFIDFDEMIADEEHGFMISDVTGL